MTTSQFQSMDAYIATFPKEIQTLLGQVRETIRKAAPDATEAIKYAMPTFVLNGKNLVHFAAFKDHIGFYATPTGHEAFKDALSKYKSGKGSVQFPLDEPMPLELVSSFVAFRVAEINRNQSTAMKKSKPG
jgi:uncharacterized protein YdhG (YjbR/CyaY superfamily)